MLNTDDQNKYKQLYLDNAQNYLKELRTNLAVVKDTVNNEAIDNIHRIAHSLKSSSLLMGYQQTAELCRLVEYIFAKIKTGTTQIDENIKNLMSELVTTLEKNLGNIKINNQEIDLLPVTQKLESVIK